MNLYTKCNDCNAEFKFWTFENTRVELAMSDGEHKEFRCKNCGASNKVHVDELNAKQSRLALLISIIILIVGTPIIFYLVYYVMDRFNVIIVGGFLLVPITVYGLIRKQDQNRVDSFNRNKLKD